MSVNIILYRRYTSITKPIHLHITQTQIIGLFINIFMILSTNDLKNQRKLLKFNIMFENIISYEPDGILSRLSLKTIFFVLA